MTPGLVKNPATPERRWGRALQCLLAFWAIMSVLSCATPAATSDGGSLTRAAPLPATEAPQAATLEAEPSPEASKVPEATLTFTDTPTSTDTPIPITSTPLSTTLPLPGTAQAGPPVYSYRIVSTYPHDQGAFTQGLVYEDGVLYEGTGLWGQSTLRKGDLETGGTLQSYSLPDQLFGEGITVWGDSIIQLTWKAGVGFVYDRDSLELLETFGYATEGWGITHDGTNLIMSDGTAVLHIWDAETFEEIGQILVHDEQGPVVWLNELEYVQGKIYANVWQTDRVAIIEPETGRVTAWIDLGGLLGGTELSQPVDVLNGIAYDADGERLFVTGKWWPSLFEVELIPADESPE